MSYEKLHEELNNLDRASYMKVYQSLGNKMFSDCVIPNAYDLITADEPEAKEKIENISNYTENTEDIMESIHRTTSEYSEKESAKFINSVIASNVTNITESGYFYKKLMSSCDSMKIVEDDCKSGGDKLDLPISKEIYDYKVKYRYIKELKEYTESYEDFVAKTKDRDTVHVRTFLGCKTDPKHRHFCKKCAGLFRRAKDLDFTPHYIGEYSTLMITEHATQASLDSMNKGVTEKMNTLLETKLDETYSSYKKVKDTIYEIIDKIGNIGVQSRYYEIALLSRFYLNDDNKTFTAKPLVTSFTNNDDALGVFIYKPTFNNMIKLLQRTKFTAGSTKSRLFLDNYE